MLVQGKHLEFDIHVHRNLSVEVPRLPGIRAYFTRLSRHRVEPSRRVGAPRRLVICRLAAKGVVEILGLVHDRMVLSRAARTSVRDADER